MLFLIDFIPDLVWVLLFFVGVTLMIAGQFLRGVPAVMQYRIPIIFAGFLSLMISTWALGAIANEEKWQKRLKEAEEQIKEQEAKATQLNEQLEKEVAEKKELAEKKNKVVIKEIEKWNTKEILKEVKVEGPERVKIEEVVKYIENCPVPKEMLDIHNKAAIPPGKKIEEPIKDEKKGDKK